MAYRFIILLLCSTPVMLSGQAIVNTFKNHNNISIDEIYAIIKTVIKKEKLDRSYGLNLIPESNCNTGSDDSSYLQTLLIKSPKAFIPNVDSLGNVVVSNLTFPDKNILTTADIEYMLEAKPKFKDLKWDNKRLGFDLKNRKNYYTFSIPYFTKRHDKVILMYENLCSGLCGTGSTILLSKKGNSWDITDLQSWFH
jgi:hypothetical protein